MVIIRLKPLRFVVASNVKRLWLVFILFTLFNSKIINYLTKCSLKMKYFVPQTLMSAWPPIHVTKVLTASTTTVLSPALVDKDLREMEPLAKVLMDMFVRYLLSCLFIAWRCNSLFCLRYRRVFQEWQPLWRECGLFEQRRIIHLYLQRWIYRKWESLWW